MTTATTAYYKRPSWFRVRLINPLITIVVRRVGVGGSGADLLSILRVRGHQSGRLYEIPVRVAILDDHRYLVSMLLRPSGPQPAHGRDGGTGRGRDGRADPRPGNPRRAEGCVPAAVLPAARAACPLRPQGGYQVPHQPRSTARAACTRSFASNRCSSRTAKNERHAD